MAHGSPRGGAADFHAAAQERLTASWVPRDQLEEWHRTLDQEAYVRRVRGVAVRFLAADMTYKVGWVSQYESQSVEGGQASQGPQDCLVVDAGHGANEIVLLRNVSNTKFKLEEIPEPIIAALRDSEMQRIPSTIGARGAGGGAAAIPAPRLHPHVLMLGGDGEVMGHESITEVVGQASEQDPDTPRGAGQAWQNPGMGIPEQEMVSARANTGTAEVIRQMEARTDASAADDRWLRNLCDMSMQMANTEGRRGGGVSKPYYVQQVLQLCRHVEQIMQQEGMLIHLKSPAYVFGDIHGNYDDLSYFLNKLVPFGMINTCAAHLLFLGDYVDRGHNGLECTVHLLALKCMAKRKVTLLRGNHEAPEVNGDVAEYGALSFKHECHRKLGESKGEEVWAAVNRVFRLLPGAAVLDNKVFACHGGIPRYTGGPDDRLDILASPDFPRLPQIQAPDVNDDLHTGRCRQIMEDLVWSDPAAPSEPTDHFGFGDNRRGPGLKTFGSAAVDTFLKTFGFSHIFRAHQEKSNGLRISDNARVVTIFSTSDYVGHQNGAGVVYIGDGTIRMIIKKPLAPPQAPIVSAPQPRRKTQG